MADPSVLRIRCDRSDAWSALRTLRAGHGATFDLRGAFEQDPGRFEAFSQEAPCVFADLSKNWIDSAIEHQLLALARECGVEQHRDALLGCVNDVPTEHREIGRASCRERV